VSRRAKQGHTGGPVPAGTSGPRPLVAIVGRPNVGKSTLFNRLVGAPLAIVEDRPGVTRDRHYADTRMLGREVVLIDTGGFDPDSDDPMQQGIAGHVRLALDECDVVVAVLDGTAEPTQADREAVQLLRRSKKPVVYVANKADSNRAAWESTSHYSLGVGEIIPVSALHGRGLGDMEQAVFDCLPPEADTSSVNLDLARVALVGRPNAGKSSLVNRLTGESRQLVDDRPGTTVDSVDTYFESGDDRFVLIDTAGIRRKRSVEDVGVEAMSVFQAIRAMERSHVVVLVIDANAGAAEQDAKIAGLAVDRGRALVIALNKSDLVDRDTLAKSIDRTREILAFCPWAPLVTISAKTGRGTKTFISRIVDAAAEHTKRVPTAEMNRFFEEVLAKHPPPTMHGRETRLYYVTQAEVRPPTFAVMTNEPEGVHFSYQRYVVNEIRERFGFRGTPIRVRYRPKKKKDEE